MFCPCIQAGNSDLTFLLDVNSYIPGKAELRPGRIVTHRGAETTAGSSLD